MSKIDPASQALDLVRDLQKTFVTGLERCSKEAGTTVQFELAEWLRDEGRHGGGSRYFSAENEIFNRASVNISHIHYHDEPDKKLASATALSTIIHPNNPHAPSLHMHISWTEMKGGQGGYWRVMGDLNPSIEKPEDTALILQCFQKAAPAQFDEAVAQGDKYFNIPALQRHRGVAHFYLEQYRTGDPDADLKLAEEFSRAVIQCYLTLLERNLSSAAIDSDYSAQLAYHTLYLFQVLTLDRGTTSGLLVHDQNDLGIMGSLPSRVDRALLASWANAVSPPQDILVQSIAQQIPENGEVTNDVRLALAKAVRAHYRNHLEALNNQASGNVVPPTVDNHR